MLIKRLDWDSDFFGFEVGKLQLEENEQIPSGLLCENDFKLIYVFSDTPLKWEATEEVEVKLVDVKVTYQKEKLQSVRNDVKIESSLTWSKKMEELAYQSGEYSRFKIDDNFAPTVFLKMYEIWLRSSLAHEIASEVMVFNPEDPEGFLTVNIQEEEATVGLIAVDNRSRGKGVGKRLMQQLEGLALKNHVSRIKVATQEANVIANRFYKSLGYIVAEKHYIYHVWKK